jgi:uncharacterized protein (TIGR00369 family)
MSVHKQWLEKIASFKARSNLTLPPPSLAELKLEYTEIEPKKSMQAKLPFQKRFTNPLGVYQGGFLAAAIDEVFGPLSYLTAEGPCMTLSMNLTFLRPFTEQMGHCLIQAKVLKESQNFIFMRAEVVSLDGELLAHSESHVTKVKA